MRQEVEDEVDEAKRVWQALDENAAKVLVSLAALVCVCLCVCLSRKMTTVLLCTFFVCLAALWRI